MNKIIRFAINSAAGTALIAMIVVPLTASATTPISLSPATGEAGSTFTLKYSTYANTANGSNFSPETDKVWFSNDDYSALLTSTGDDGDDGKLYKVPESVCPGVRTESCSSNFSVATPVGNYDVYAATNNAQHITTTSVARFKVTASTTQTPTLPSSGVHDPGTNVKGPDGTVYRIFKNARYPYTSAGAFLSYKFNTWAGVVTASTEDMALPISTDTPCGLTTPITYYIPPRNGSLILDHGTVYLIKDGERAGFASEQAFKELGYSYANVSPGDTSFMCINAEPINTSAIRHPNGTLINQSGTLYVMRNGLKSGFPSMAVLESWGYSTSEAVPANTFDEKAAQGEILQTRTVDQLNL